MKVLILNVSFRKNGSVSMLLEAVKTENELCGATSIIICE